MVTQDLNSYINGEIQNFLKGLKKTEKKAVIEQRLFVDGNFHYLYPRIYEVTQENIEINEHLYSSQQVISVFNHILEMNMTSFSEFHSTLSEMCEKQEEHHKRNFFYEYHETCFLKYFSEYLPKLDEICQLTRGLLVVQISPQTYLFDKQRPYAYQINSPYKFSTYKIIYADNFGRIMLQDTQTHAIKEEYVLSDSDDMLITIDDIMQSIVKYQQILACTSILTHQ